MASFNFELVSPDKLLFSGPAASVLVPGSDGDFLVLTDHAPVMAALRPGVVTIEDAAGKQAYLARFHPQAAEEVRRRLRLIGGPILREVENWKRHASS